jgi:hypothetical protein
MGRLFKGTLSSLIVEDGVSGREGEGGKEKKSLNHF